MKTVLLSASILILLGLGGILILKGIQLDINCTGHLKRAADANNPKTAEAELKSALDYLEANNMTSGYTSIFYNTPDEDIEFFYNNIKESYIEVSQITDSTSSLETSNILMKLRETLMDTGKKGNHLTVPNGLSLYPYNTNFAIITAISIIVILLTFLGIVAFD